MGFPFFALEKVGNGGGGGGEEVLSNEIPNGSGNPMEFHGIRGLHGIP